MAFAAYLQIKERKKHCKHEQHDLFIGDSDLIPGNVHITGSDHQYAVCIHSAFVLLVIDQCRSKKRKVAESGDQIISKTEP